MKAKVGLGKSASAAARGSDDVGQSSSKRMNFNSKTLVKNYARKSDLKTFEADRWEQFKATD